MSKHVDVDAIIRDQGLEKLSPKEFDALPFGSIKLDAEFKVVLYNAKEQEIAKRSAVDTLGKDFFREIAPCTNNASFRGRLDKLIKDGKNSDRFDYEFLFPWGARFVCIQLWIPDPETRWIFVTPV